MANDTNLTPAPSPIPAPQPTAAPAQAPVQAPVIPTSTTAPDLSALIAPAQSVGEAQQDFQNARNLANQPLPTPKPGPHAKLISMVQGLALGLSAAGTAISTHGREGGAPEVEQVQAEQQNQKLQQQEFLQSQRNQQIQQQLTAGNTALTLGESYRLLASMPEELEAKHVDVQAAQQNLSQNEADFRASHGGMSANQFNTALSSTGPATTQSGANSFFLTNAQQQLSGATKILGSNDPYVQKLQSTLDNPAATSRDLMLATNQLQNQLALNEKVNQAAQTAPLGDKANVTNSMMEQRWQVLHPGTPLPGAFKLNATSTPADFARVDKILQQSEQSEATKAQRDQTEAYRQAQMNMQRGTPEGIASTASMVENGQIAFPSSFALRTPYWQNVMQQIKKDDPNFTQERWNLVSGYTTGSQSKQINAINTALGHAAELEKATQALNNGDIKALNSIANAYGIQAGTGPGAAAAVYKLIVHRLGPEIATAYLGAGGTGAERDDIGKDLDPSLSPNILNGNLKETIRLFNSKIGALRYQWDQNASPNMKSFDDRFLDSDAKAALTGAGVTLGNQPTIPSGATHTAKGSDGKLHYTNSQGQDLGVVLIGQAK